MVSAMAAAPATYRRRVCAWVRSHTRQPQVCGRRRCSWWIVAAAATAAAVAVVSARGLAWAAPVTWAALGGDRLQGQRDLARSSSGRARASRFMRRLLHRTRAANEQASNPVTPRTRAEQRTELIKMTDASIMTTAGLIGALAGLALGGLWFGAALFAAFSYITREKSDNPLTQTMRGVARGTIEVLNMTAEMEEKYEVTNKVGGALGTAAQSAKKDPSVAPAVGFVEGIGKAVKDFDTDVGILETAGTLSSSASDLAATVVGKAADAIDASTVQKKFEEELRKASGDTAEAPKKQV